MPRNEKSDCFSQSIIQKTNKNILRCLGDVDMKKLKSDKKISLLSILNNNPLLIGDPKQINKKLGNIISKLDDIKEIDIISRIKEEYDSHTKSLETEKCLRFLTVGGYSSGKSTLLNTVIIGQDILTVSAKECTRTGLIIKHSDKHIVLYNV